MKNISIIGGMMHMQSQQTLNKQKLIVVINITFSCITSTAIFLCLFYINHTLYSNVISMVPFLLLFQLSILCCALASKTKRNFFQIIAALIIFTEVALFHLYSPPYSVSKAISTVQNSKSSLIIRQNKEYATMSTTVYLNPFVKAGYVFRCFDNDANKQYNIFFNPISGDFFNIQ